MPSKSGGVIDVVAGRLDCSFEPLALAVRRRIGEIGGMPLGDTPDDLRKRVAVELARWPAVVRPAALRFDPPS